jgi:hypothetical protein
MQQSFHTRKQRNRAISQRAARTGHTVVYSGKTISETLEMVCTWMRTNPRFQIIIDPEAKQLTLHRKRE